MTTFSAIHNLVQLCAQHGIQAAIVSPGSRSAPLTAALAHHPDITARVVMDERAAAFVALGLAQRTRRPVILVCTSGTAGLNYAPAIAEAYYQQVPLLVLTADRPPEWIDQQDNQTSQQTDWYGRHVRGSWQAPVDLTHPDAHWHMLRQLNEALNRSRSPVPGPVHLNIPLREPLYPATDAEMTFEPVPTFIQQPLPQSTLDQSTWRHLVHDWQAAPRKLILVGRHTPDARLTAALETLQHDPGVAIVADITANIGAANRLPHADIITSAPDEQMAALAPDLLISLGGPLVSKSLKLFLRRRPPAQHWRLDPGGEHIDTYQNLTHVLTVDPVYFLARLAALQPDAAETTVQYAAGWLAAEAQAQALRNTFLPSADFGEFQAVAQVLAALPPQSCLQLGNSMPVRYANYLGVSSDVRVDSNRGTSGIDGTVSTAVGAALSSDHLTTLIAGDLGFFYDRNALWHNHVPPNLRIVILNNHGGGIFRLIDGPGRLSEPVRETYFDTPHPLRAERTAADHGLQYRHAATATELEAALSGFFDRNLGPAILEIESGMATNTRVFEQFKAQLRQLRYDIPTPPSTSLKGDS